MKQTKSHGSTAHEVGAGGSGKKVTSRKQAIAIGLSEARRAGGKVPATPRAAAARKKAKPRSGMRMTAV